MSARATISARDTLPVAIVISGRGSNMAAIARACADGRIQARVAAVIADRTSATGISLADSLGLATQIVPAVEFQDRAAFEAALEQAIERSAARLVVLAGFMRILSVGFVQHLAGRLLNIHPSLLPDYKGLHTHRRVLQAGERVHGVSVHFVTAELDGGPVIYQGRLPVLPGDTEESLAARVHQLEHRIYPEVIGLIAAGRLELKGATVVLDGQALAAPLLQEESHEHAHAPA